MQSNELAIGAERELPWRCFHCDFVTSNVKEAAAHFGDVDDAEEFKPVCLWWNRMTLEERGQALQDVVQQLNDERTDNAEWMERAQKAEAELAALRKAVEGLVPYMQKRAEGLRQHIADKPYQSEEARLKASGAATCLDNVANDIGAFILSRLPAPGQPAPQPETAPTPEQMKAAASELRGLADGLEDAAAGRITPLEAVRESVASSCTHERLDEDGICRGCGKDCRGIA